MIASPESAWLPPVSDEDLIVIRAPGSGVVFLDLSQVTEILFAVSKPPE